MGSGVRGLVNCPFILTFEKCYYEVRDTVVTGPKLCTIYSVNDLEE